MALAITPLLCGMRKVQASLPGGSCAGESANCTVLLSSATSTMAMATGVTPDPSTMSALSSFTMRRKFCTALVGSVPSSRITSLIFSPPIVAGHILSPLFMGTPRPEPWPVSGKLTPTVTSARAAWPTSSVAAIARVVLMKLRMGVSPGLMALKSEVKREAENSLLTFDIM